MAVTETAWPTKSKVFNLPFTEEVCQPLIQEKDKEKKKKKQRRRMGEKKRGKRKRGLKKGEDILKINEIFLA